MASRVVDDKSNPRLVVSPPMVDPSSTPASIPHESSDCGSSSGVGGMKGTSHDGPASSDEGGSSSSEQTPGAAVFSVPPPSLAHPLLPFRRGHGLPLPPPLEYGGTSPVATPSSSSPPFGPSPPPVTNDLFVHIQVGETLTIVVGSDIRPIHGPATVRMVGESGVAPTALPLHVPPGHQIHQIIDEQGVLRHLILSPELPREMPRLPPPSTSSAVASTCSGGAVPSPPSINPSFYTINRRYGASLAPVSPKSSANVHNMPDVVSTSATAHETPNYDMDQEDFDRLREMLNRVHPPTTGRMFAVPGGTDVELMWQELDTSEACAVGGPFPYLDASEFSYTLYVFDARTKSSPVFVHRVGPKPKEDDEKNVKNNNNNMAAVDGRSSCMARKLCPNRDYRASIRASLEERGIQGECSPSFAFRTLMGAPDAPRDVRVDGIGADFIVLRWNSGQDNGSPILGYKIHSIDLTSDKKEECMHQTHELTCRLMGLKAATKYQLRVIGVNRLGESLPSSMVTAVTRLDVKFMASVTASGPRAVKIAWPTLPLHSYSVEMLVGKEQLYQIKSRITTSFAFSGDLSPGLDCAFRVICHSPDGLVDIPTDWVSYRVPNERKGLPAPPKPQVLAMPREGKRLEISWRSSLRDITYVVEGAPASLEWRSLYKGNATSLVINDNSFCNFRVQVISKRSNSASEYSEVLTVSLPARLPQMPPPRFSSITKHSMDMEWSSPSGAVVPSTATLLYDLRRIDGASQLIYSGPSTSFTLEGLKARQHVSVQIRAVAVEQTGGRVEGEWSSIGTGCTTRDAPPAPHSLRLSEDRRELLWTSGEEMEVVHEVSRCTLLEDGALSDPSLHECTGSRMALSDLVPGVAYAFQVKCKSSWGESPSSEVLRFSTPAEAPLAPESLSVTANAQKSLLLRWSAPDCRGSSLRSYHLKVEKAKEVVRERTISASSSSQLDWSIDDLDPDTSYRLSVAASNDVGQGPSSMVEGKTKRLPPPPPSLEAEAESAQIKLKWRSPSSDGPSPLSYRIVRLSDGSDSHVPVYDGDHHSTKLKGLHENTTYRFRIRSFDKETGAGAWSEVYSFTTPMAAPPSVRAAPSTTSQGGGIHSVEWTHVIPKGNQKGFFYRLQTTENNERREWRTVYEGAVPSFVLRVPPSSSLQARVVVVRPDAADGICSQPSPPAYMSNLGERNEATSALRECKEEEKSEDNMTTLIRDFLGTNYLITIFMMVFVLASIGLFACYDFLGIVPDPPAPKP